tara:strand:- start:71197 stop:71997 length:801 start_codon:yes stop_codon:yes gene_type:complete
MKNSPIIDIGANLTHPDLFCKIDEIVKKMREEYVTKAVIISSTFDDTNDAMNIIKKYPDMFYTTIGFHPHNAKDYSDNYFEAMKIKTNDPEIVAIGECGLDYYREYSSKENQIRCFERHLELSSITKKPLFLHERNAHKDFFDILSTHIDTISKFVVHCFTGNSDHLRRYLDIGAHIGITGWITDQARGSHLHDLVQYIPRDRLMIETDSPYLIPHNLDTKSSNTNYPYYLPFIALFMSECLNITVDELRKSTYETTLDFFGLHTK